jgi:GNAT superfamily N-acetyltransferase
VTQPSPIASEHQPAADASWHVRCARADELPAVAEAVAALLRELGGKPAPASALEEAARTLLADRSAGVLLVAKSRRTIVGLLGASWQAAIHVPGRYGLIQELWVHPSWRGRTIGGDLLAALFELAHQQQISRVEVGLPQSHFAGIAATEGFYRDAGFTPLGPRMRWERA